MKYFLLILLILFTIPKSFSQTNEIYGKIIANGDVENLHVMNATLKQNTISDIKGEFKLKCNINDTIIITSIRYSSFKLIVTKKNIEEKKIICALQENINKLDEIILGKILTGDLNSDIKNIKGKPPINFYDLGIKGYTGKQKTLNERRLYTASGGNFLSVDKIINGISGYTKKLENYVALDSKKVFLQNLKREFSKELFNGYKFEDNIKNEFFSYFLDNSEFILACENKNNFEIFSLLKNELNKFLKQRNANNVYN